VQFTESAFFKPFVTFHFLPDLSVQHARGIKGSLDLIRMQSLAGEFLALLVGLKSRD
jgi:hypothetical protein